jgi:hypothetical protein
MISSRFSSFSRSADFFGTSVDLVQDLARNAMVDDIRDRAADLAELSTDDVDAIATRATVDPVLRGYNFELSEGFCFVLASDMRAAVRLIRERGLHPRVVHPVLQAGVFFISGPV